MPRHHTAHANPRAELRRRLTPAHAHLEPFRTHRQRDSSRQSAPQPPPPQDPTAGRAGSKQGKARKKKPPAASSSASSASAPPNDPTGRSVVEPPAAVAPPLPPPSQSDTGGEVSARGGTHTSTGSEVSTPEVRKRKRNRGHGAKALSGKPAALGATPGATSGSSAVGSSQLAATPAATAQPTASLSTGELDLSLLHLVTASMGEGTEPTCAGSARPSQAETSIASSYTSATSEESSETRDLSSSPGVGLPQEDVVPELSSPNDRVERVERMERVERVEDKPSTSTSFVAAGALRPARCCPCPRCPARCALPAAPPPARPCLPARPSPPLPSRRPRTRSVSNALCTPRFRWRVVESGETLASGRPSQAHERQASERQVWPPQGFGQAAGEEPPSGRRPRVPTTAGASARPAGHATSRRVGGRG